MAFLALCTSSHGLVGGGQEVLGKRGRKGWSHCGPDFSDRWLAEGSIGFIIVVSRLCCEFCVFLTLLANISYMESLLIWGTTISS